ncbi:hypothetical protein FKM82_005205 [Ascaphus truei]
MATRHRLWRLRHQLTLDLEEAGRQPAQVNKSPMQMEMEVDNPPPPPHKEQAAAQAALPFPCTVCECSVCVYRKYTARAPDNDPFSPKYKYMRIHRRPCETSYLCTEHMVCEQQ